MKNILNIKFAVMHIEMYMCRYPILALLLLCNAVAFGACRPYIVTAGAESYFLDRVRSGGTQQSGWINGARVGIDRIKRYGWYVGADYLYATGCIKGNTATGRCLNSCLTDEIAEVRLGYTLQQDDCHCSFITPFGGYGYFREVNDFHSPSPLPCTFTDSFSYAVVGFLSGTHITPRLTMGVNFKVRFMQNGKSVVSDDPVYDTVTLKMEDEIHVRVDVPFAFTPPRTPFGIGFLLSPFYEYRHFGGREGFPFNFRDTQFYLYGARFALTYQF